MYFSQDLPEGEARRSLHEKIAHDIGVKIVRGDFPEMSLLPTELALADKYQASRTAVREAFRILAAKGLTMSRPKVGTRIRQRSDWNMLDIDVLSWHLKGRSDPAFLDSLFDVCAVIEPEAAAVAAVRRTEKQLRSINVALQAVQRLNATREALIAADLSFHHAVLDASGNPLFSNIGLLTESILKYNKDASLPASSAMQSDLEVIEANTRRHVAIYSAIRDRDPLAARQETAALVRDVRLKCGRPATG